MKLIINKILKIPMLIINWVILKKNKVTFTKFISLKINGYPKIFNKGLIIFNNGVRINSGFKSNPIGGQIYTSFLVKKDAKLIIEENVGISNSSIVCYKEITIGRNTLIGNDCKIYDTNFHSLEYSERMNKKDNDIISMPIKIMEGCFIGAGSLILKGTTIGKFSIVGANSVVTKSIPEYEVWAGNPAKFIRKIKVDK